MSGNEQQMNLALESIVLQNLSMMTCLFVGPKNLVSLQNLTKLTIAECEKLKIVFSTSTVRCLPQLLHMGIEECKELKHIIEDDLENKKSPNLMSATKTCFPKLKALSVIKCNKLKYVFPISICRELPKLRSLMIREADELEEIFVSEGDDLESKKPSNFMSTTKTRFPKLEYLAVVKCNKLNHVFPISICKELPELYDLRIEECNELSHIIEDDLESKKPSNSMSTTKTCFPKLSCLAVVKCNKLNHVFPISICKEFPELYDLRIEECNELRHIIEDDLENTTKTCFPNLSKLVVLKCNKLKYVFPISICKELPELKALIIREADELDEIFANEGDDHKVEIPNLQFVVFENLLSLCHAQGIQFQAVKHRFIQNCPKLSLASASTADFRLDVFDLFRYGTHYPIFLKLLHVGCK